MKLTKKQEAGILKVYNEVWNANLRGDIRTFASMLDENCHIIGSAAGEVFKNKKAAVKFYTATADQLAGKAEMRNRKISVTSVDSGVIVNEESDFYFLIDDQWTYYGHARITCLFHKKNNQWKVTHMHNSFPDSKTEEGEQVNTDKIKAENIQLRDAVKRRTEELENKNRELEIETSLEKVRTIAMGMRKPEDFPDVCEVLFKELQSLGFNELRNAMVNIHNDEKRSFVNYDYSDEIGKSITPLVYNEHSVIKKQLKQIRKADDAFSESVFKGKDLEDWKTFRKSRGEKNDKRIKNIKALYYYFYSIGTGSIGISTFDRINEEKKDLLKRFRNVFAFAYRRYMDVAQAEAQAKEARIELALERVRARAMAMHNSDELAELVATVFNELTHLDFKLTSCIIWIHDHEKAMDILWIASAEMNKPAKPFRVTPFHNGFFGSIIHAWKAKDPKWVYAFTGVEKKKFEKAFFKELPNLPVALKKALNVPKHVVFSASFNNFGGLEIVETEALTNEKFEILHRFGKVFDLSYTRFNDLKKAEAQAREAQIEAALEKVRGRAMAMHKSEELLEAGALLYSELSKLGIEKLTSGYMLIDEDEKMGWNYGVNPTNGKIIPKPVGVPLTETKEIRTILEAWKKQEPIHVKHLDPKETIIHQSYMADHAINFPISKEKLLSITPERLVIHTFNFKQGYLIIVRGEELAAEQQEMVVRFAKVFEMTYRRFLDLQKAEAQVREAQIETALERVRSKTMAMHKSEEVTGIAVSLNEELMKLGFQGGSTIIIINKETGDMEQWSGFSEDKTLKSCYVPYFKHSCHDATLDAWKRGEKFLVYKLTGEEKKTFDKHYFATGYKDFPESDKKWMRKMETVTFSYAFMKYGAIHWGPDHLTEEQLKILQRFSKVFEQSYTRFLDLQKAEAQAREAKIEAALERVRSRSMAMHKSDDLHEVIKVVTEQLYVLGLKFNVANFAKIDPDASWDLWLSTPEQAYPALIHVPYIDHPIFSRITEEGTKGNDFFTDVYTREEANIFFHHFFENTIAKNSPEERKQFVYNSKGFTRSLFLTKNIWFSVGRYDVIPFADQENAIFKRFANVFEQAYTRFLDLQKAEAQAREADIELSLERVRAKTMAMQKPSEFVDVINIIGEQFVHLGFDIDWANFGANGFAISEGIDIWNFAVIPGGSPISARVFIPYFDHPVFTNSAANINEFLKGGRDLITVTFDKQTKDTWLDHLFTKTIFKDVPEEYRVIQYAKSGYTTSNISLKDTWLSIGKFDSRPFTDEQHSILRRFAKAFGQAYTRFLDLQKAEAQAREAQIEASLERVRSRAMAMQNSDELRELIGTVFTELTKLDIVLTRCLIMIYDPRSNDSIWWMANSEAPTEPIGLRIQNHEHPPYAAYLKAWQEKKLKWVYVLEGAVKKDWDDFLFVETQLSHLPDFVIAGMKAPERVYLNSSFNSFGNLTLASLEPLSNEHSDILLRFAKVFDLTYTRFNDLKQAEAQAKESKIQLALERVRARTMAMQKSNELTETSFLLFQQFKELGSVANQMSIGIIKEQENVMEMFATIDGNKLNYEVNVSLNEPIVMKKLVVAWEEQKRSLVLDLSGADLKAYNDYRNSSGTLKFETKEGDHWVIHIAFFSKGILSFSSHEHYTDEIVQLLERFAAVFDLTYTRFLDLQKAEAQTKEAQIELALERVRARTMAMHKSEELAETSQVLFQQLLELGRVPDRISIGIADEVNGVVNFWSTDQQGSHLDHSFSARLNERTTISKTYQAWKEQKKSLVVDLHGEDLKEWIQFAREEMGIAVKDDQIKDRRVHSLAFFSHGWILVTSHEPQSTETIQILERFASVFNLTYRRFLDLQKAEAQANEARIEIALERIRARALAMHKSDELMEVANVLREQMALLGQPELESSVVHLYEEDPDNILSWRSFKAKDPKSKIGYGHMAIPKNCCEVVREWLTKFYSDLKEYTIEISGTKQEEWYDILFKLAPDVVNSMRQENSIHEKRYYRFSKFSGGALLMVSKQEPSEEVTYLQRRTAVVFDLAYRRFSDLQKAEAQARESQIETALEKVRSRSLAMHKSDELQEVVDTVFERLQELNFEMASANIAIFKEGTRNYDYWIASPAQKRSASFHMPYKNISLTRDLIAARESGKEFSTTAYSFEEKNEWFGHAFKDTDFKFLSEERKKFILNAPAITVAIAFSKNTGVQVNRYNSKLYTEGEGEILKRFSKVFEQAYIRFLDLQKAEANAREAQIEAGLERVRAKAMAMHSSKDLAETLSVFYRELKSLSVVPIRCGVALMDKESRMAELTTMNTTGEGDSIEIIGKIKMAGHPVLDGVFESWLVQKEYHAVLRGNQIKEYYQVLKPQIDYLDYSHDEAQFGYYFMFNEGDVYAWTEKELTEDELTIYRRFTTVISLTYKRYKDLQQAEAQAREAKIEAGLERVRARTMAMHSSEDVGAATATMFTELEKLGIQNLRGGITIIKAGDKQEVWGVTNLPDGRTIRSIGEFDMHLHPLWRELLKAKLNKGDYNYYRLAGKDKEDYLDILNATPNYLSQPIKDFPDVHVQSYFFGEGAIWTNSLQPHSEEDKQVMKRFASVFSLTFRRYQDLQKAEAQAREATIEASLERVRGKAMAMHSSKDLATTIGVFYHELEGLDLTPRRCGVGLISKETKMAEISTMNASADGEGIEMVGNLDLRTHPVLTSVYNNWLTKTEYHPVLRGNEIKEYYQIVRPQIDFPDYPNDTVQYGYFFFFDEGGVYAWTEKELTEEELKIYRRFTSVLSLTYKRYKDLKDAEASAQAAIKDAALDRIRADIASMRTIADLDRITPLIWNELTILGIPFIRCGVFIMDEEQQLIHTFLSTPDGKAIAAFHLSYDTPGNLNHVVSNWKIKNKYIDHWDESEFKQFAEILMKQGALVSAEQYLKTIPKGGFYLHFLPFLQGMLYVGNTTQLEKEEIELIQHVADAFSTAYARYEDFNKLEAAKQQVEKTLTDLKQAQTQLVQSEKMASLGEMTAGIAHEIQNPLNFVNNFSEVSKELLDEMKAELETGNTEDAKGIADDVIQNLEKINHHGKRADAIVKSMLQHSRSSSGKKEPADINGLADEYLRLAYHGLRAKDKSFNAKFETEFDSSIGKINIISQDIGRVLVNLINNAFYAVSERKKQESNGYEPTVTVHTKKTDDKIEIMVKDNGNGIPQKVLDKIFQPFFTTKPTGQGTGLGLSLAYDIVTKGHGGELKVETKEGQGSEFIIQLPVAKTPES